ncbi:hypothetical protein OAF63_06760 [Saprospiraceae bacterium]|jgi:hypothetical protein|nr:hypothetical protein [Bacteroidota bacterium]MDB4728476.1 hypothetical protein [Saprospiraceae bacterium]MDF1864727.1 hypothetical protein [Saprospiraceae bacterium]
MTDLLSEYFSIFMASLWGDKNLKTGGKQLGEKRVVGFETASKGKLGVFNLKMVLTKKMPYLT